MTDGLPAIMAVQRTVNVLWKQLRIPTSHVSPNLLQITQIQLLFCNLKPVFKGTINILVALSHSRLRFIPDWRNQQVWTVKQSIRSLLSIRHADVLSMLWMWLWSCHEFHNDCVALFGLTGTGQSKSMQALAAARGARSVKWSGTKPLPESMFTQIYVAIWCV